MAQLKSTNVTGNLTVTGNVIANDIPGYLKNGNGDMAFASGDGWSSLSVGKNSKFGIITLYKDNTFLDLQIQGTLSSASKVYIPAINGKVTMAYKDSNGCITATSFNADSDKRIKENIQPYIPTKSILELPIYKYDYIDGPKNQIGCLAQDLQIICPEIVYEKEDGYLSIQESKIVYLLIDEIKKLKQEVAELRGE